MTDKMREVAEQLLDDTWRDELPGEYKMEQSRRHDQLCRTYAQEFARAYLKLDDQLGIVANYALKIADEERSKQHRKDLFQEMMNRIRAIEEVNDQLPKTPA